MISRSHFSTQTYHTPRCVYRDHKISCRAMDQPRGWCNGAGVPNIFSGSPIAPEHLNYTRKQLLRKSLDLDVNPVSHPLVRSFLARIAQKSVHCATLFVATMQQGMHSHTRSLNIFVIMSRPRGGRRGWHGNREMGRIDGDRSNKGYVSMFSLILQLSPLWA